MIYLRLFYEFFKAGLFSIAFSRRTAIGTVGRTKYKKILGETGYERLRLQPFRSGKSLSFHVGKRGKTGGRCTILS